MLITADQIRAARALKNWSQTDLAERTGLAVPTIANIELGKQMPGKNTIEKIIDAFSIGGISFTQNGVEFDKKDIYSLVGTGKFQKLLEDAIRTLHELAPKDREFLMYYPHDDQTTEEEVSLFQEMKKSGIKIRSITASKGRIIEAIPQEIRQIDKEYFERNGAVFIYADRLALYTEQDEISEATTIVITNPRIASIYKKMFAFMWDSLNSQEDAQKKKGRK